VTNTRSHHAPVRPSWAKGEGAFIEFVLCSEARQRPDVWFIV